MQGRSAVCAGFPVQALLEQRLLPAGDKMQGWPGAGCALPGSMSLWGTNTTTEESLLHTHQPDTKPQQWLKSHFETLIGARVLLRELTSPPRAWPCQAVSGAPFILMRQQWMVFSQSPLQERAHPASQTCTHPRSPSPCLLHLISASIAELIRFPTGRQCTKAFRALASSKPIQTLPKL